MTVESVARAVLALVAISGCAGEEGSPEGDTVANDAAIAADPASPSEPIDLVDHHAWVAVAPEDDPLALHRPAEVTCDIAGWYVEAEELEMQTARCNYVALVQPSLGDVAAGDSISLELRHFDLTSPEPAEAHVALLFGESVEWEATIAIPFGAEVLTPQWQAKSDLATGEPVHFHLHNHGQNTWTLAFVRRE